MSTSRLPQRTTRALINRLLPRWANPQDKEDLKQEGHLAALLAFKHFQEELGIPLEAFTALVVKRHLRHYLRRTLRPLPLQQEITQEDNLQEDNWWGNDSRRSQSEESLAVENKLTAQTCLSLLHNHRLRQALELHYLHDLSTREVARELKISVRSAHRYIRTGLSVIRAELQNHAEKNGAGKSEERKADVR
jgi:RNA polymerase sigma factor (sigma-70 family)